MADENDKLLETLRVACRRLDIAKNVLRAANGLEQFKRVKEICLMHKEALVTILRVHTLHALEEFLPNLEDGSGKEFVVQWLDEKRMEETQ